jgi:hypothetical protein
VDNIPVRRKPDGQFEAVCLYSARCDDTAEQATAHPVLGDLPICPKHIAFAQIPATELRPIVINIEQVG